VVGVHKRSLARENTRLALSTSAAATQIWCVHSGGFDGFEHALVRADRYGLAGAGEFHLIGFARRGRGEALQMQG
jgi:hypothetical protein